MRTQSQDSETPRQSLKAVLTSRRFWVGFLAACAVLFLVDHVQDLTGRLLSASAVYRRVLAVGFKPLYPAHTAIVEIRYGREPDDVTLVNVCQQRLFLSRLLLAIGDASVSPAAIVLDKYFSPDACRSTGTCASAAACDGTPSLQAAVGDLLARNVRVVVGRRFNYPAMTLTPALPFPVAANGKKVIEGSLNLDDDKRRAALVWTGLREADDTVDDMETVSLKAALTLTPNLRQIDRRLNSFAAEPHGPFAGFLPLTAFDDYRFSAIELLCGKGAGREADWQTCSRPDRDALDKLHSRVVFIGENYVGVDQYQTVVGTMPGVQLQANYTEAILEEGLFRQVPPLVTYGYGFLVFVLIELASLALTSYKRVIAILGVIFGAYGLCWLVIQMTGFYLNPGLGVLGAGIAQLGHLIASKLSPRHAAAI